MSYFAIKLPRKGGTLDYSGFKGEFMNMFPNGHNQDSPNEATGNVVNIPSLAERDKKRREKEMLERKSLMKSEPMINLPSVTKYLLGCLLLVFVITNLILPEKTSTWIIETFGFVPSRIHVGQIDFYTILSPLTHMLLHGGWMHIIMNAFMLAAFGSGVERWLGGKKMFVLFVFSGLCGAALHYILNTASDSPMIGASGALSGLFAAALVMLGRGQREMGGKYGILPFALLWIGLSIGFGMLGGPNGTMIAWAAHVGGFIGGFIVLKALRV